MKILSGKYKGRNIEGYNIIGTRPTMDRIRESLFASIQDFIKGSTVLDLFAGTGALGFEALSLGASFCFFNDHNSKCTQLLYKMAQKLDIKDVDIRTLDYKKALSFYFENHVKFDLIFLDPPYAMGNIGAILEEIHEKKLLNINGLVVCEWEGEIESSIYPIYKKKVYGSKIVTIYINRES